MPGGHHDGDYDHDLDASEHYHDRLDRARPTEAAHRVGVGHRRGFREAVAFVQRAADRPLEALDHLNEVVKQTAKQAAEAKADKAKK